MCVHRRPPTYWCWSDVYYTPNERLVAFKTFKYKSELSVYIKGEGVQSKKERNAAESNVSNPASDSGFYNGHPSKYCLPIIIYLIQELQYMLIQYWFTSQIIININPCQKFTFITIYDNCKMPNIFLRFLYFAIPLFYLRFIVKCVCPLTDIVHLFVELSLFWFLAFDHLCGIRLLSVLFQFVVSINYSEVFINLGCMLAVAWSTTKSTNYLYNQGIFLSRHSSARTNLYLWQLNLPFNYFYLWQLKLPSVNNFYLWQLLLTSVNIYLWISSAVSIYFISFRIIGLFTNNYPLNLWMFNNRSYRDIRQL